MFVNYDSMFSRFDWPLVTYTRIQPSFDPLFFDEVRRKTYALNFDYSLPFYPLWIMATNRMVNPGHMDSMI